MLHLTHVRGTSRAHDKSLRPSPHTFVRRLFMNTSVLCIFGARTWVCTS